VALALDAAASSFYEDGLYNLRTEGKKVRAEDIVEMYKSWVENYPVFQSRTDWLRMTGKAGKF